MKGSSTILLTGSNSSLGRSLTNLLSSNHRLISLYRHPVPSVSDNSVSADLTDIVSIRQALTDYPRIDCLIHVAGVTDALAHLHRGHLEDNVVMARHLKTISREKGVKRLIFVSSNSVNYSHRKYAQTKLKAEEILASSGISLTIVRPTLLISPSSPELTSLFRLIHRLPFVPLIDHGRSLIQPVAVTDVAAAIYKCLNNDKSCDRIYTLAGPKPVTQRDLIFLIMSALKIHKPVLNIPRSLIKPFLALGSFFQPDYFSSLEDVLLSDLTADYSLAKKELDWQPSDPRLALKKSIN